MVRLVRIEEHPTSSAFSKVKAKRHDVQIVADEDIDTVRVRPPPH